MRSIARLLGTFGTLADSLLSLASVLNGTTDKLRLQPSHEIDPPALAHNGEILDNASPSTKRSRKTMA